MLYPTGTSQPVLRTAVLQPPLSLPHNYTHVMLSINWFILLSFPKLSNVVLVSIKQYPIKFFFLLRIILHLFIHHLIHPVSSHSPSFSTFVHISKASIHLLSSFLRVYVHVSTHYLWFISKWIHSTKEDSVFSCLCAKSITGRPTSNRRTIQWNSN